MRVSFFAQFHFEFNVCTTLYCRQYGDDWEDRFFAELGSSQADSEQDDDPEE